jgi:hypothetical protein
MWTPRTVVVVTAIVCLAGPAIASGTPAGSATPTATHPTGVLLTGVSCVSATDCFAVGYVYYGSRAATQKTLTERWDGMTWSIVPSPNQTGSAINDLDGVSCVSATFCVAVGFSQPNMASVGNALVAKWNGKAWSIMKTPPHFGADAVSCASATSCVAVGSSDAGRWNGKTWSIVKTPPHFGGAAVSCRSATSCFAVGGSVAVRWNGKSWAIVPSPQPTSGDAWGLSGVSCTSATNCQGVGSRGGCLDCFNNWVESWDGTTWSVVAAPEPTRSAGAMLNGVSCPAAASCMAVGVYGFGEFAFNVPRAFAEHWDGNTWTPFAAPEPKNSYGSFAGVSCPNPTTCFAVGESSAVLGGRIGYTGYLGPPKSAVEQWNGTSWSIVASPNPS